MNTKDEISKTAEKLFDLPENTYGKYWDILDVNNNLALCHYKDELISELKNSKNNSVQFKNLLSLRGVIFDFVQKRIVCRSYGYTSSIVLDEINEDENIVVDDINGLPVTVDISTATFKTLYDGTVVRVYKHDGVMYKSTHKKIDISGSHFRKSDYFDVIFRRFFNDKTDEEIMNTIFDPEKDYSNFVHVFILDDPELQNSTKYPVGKGFLVYLSNFFLEGIKGDFFEIDEDNIELISEWRNTTEFCEVSSFDANDNEIVPTPPHPSLYENDIYITSSFNIPIANKILKTGYYNITPDFFSKLNDCNDKRILPGEAIICEYGPSHSRRAVRIVPTSTNWRITLLDNTNNMYRQYIILLDYASPTKTVKDREGNVKYKYKDLFPEVVVKNPKDDLYVHNIRNITMCFSLAVPRFAQKESEKYLERFMSEFTSLVNFININYDKFEKMREVDFLGDERFKKNLNEINSTAKALMAFIKQYKMTKTDNVKASISRTLKGLAGPPLYSLLKLVNGRQEE